ncbi:MAG TPA: phytanoyl-CoA dioxygenase family protein [Capsulimonadaceae bacterium]|nr:phytanoyl-CoA dioxygenase family protein [Capsulimonadaceae bacterium]
MSVLSSAELAFFKENGYLIVPNAVPQENLDAVVAAIWDYLGMSPDDPASWYRGQFRGGGMVELYQHPAMWNNRQHPRVYEAFRQILGRDDLWVSVDRVNMKPPQNPDYPEFDDKGFIHWDMDTSQLPAPLAVQGVLCLTDTTEEMGGFQCVPELFRDFYEWVKTQPADRNPHHPDMTGYKATPIPAKAGDLIIWHRLLAHGNGQNVSEKPRLAQYITMFPPGGEEMRQDRIYRWRERLAPDAHWVRGDPEQREHKHGKTAELTPLGRKLLGIDLWG